MSSTMRNSCSAAISISATAPASRNILLERAISSRCGPGNHMWETNFVPDLTAIELKSWGDRGGGGTNIMFVLADGTMHAHISEMPVGSYKKAHRHGPSFHVMCVMGQGFSLLWYEHEKDFRRIDWQHGMVLVPADRQFHQHFNTGAQPARYLATAVGGLRYPMMW